LKDVEGQPVPYPVPAREVGLSEHTIEAIKEGMRRVVESQDGTGYRAFVQGLKIAAKTASAQSGGRTHAWFCAFTPVKEPRIATLVFLEQGGKGGEDAAEIGRNIIKRICLTES
jgi:peptidoglycan glycosyltransferase